MKHHLIIFLLLAALPVAGQGINFEPDDQDTTRNLIGVKVQIPAFKQDEVISALTGVYTVSIDLQMGNSWSMYAELPVVVAQTEFENESGLGNVLITFRKWLDKSMASRITLGAFLPTMDRDSYLRQAVGLYANIYRLPQFARSGTSLYANYSYNNPSDRNGIFGLQAGPDLMLPVENGFTEFLAHVSLKGGYKFERFRAWTELNALCIFTEEELISNSRLEGQLIFAGQFDFGDLNPAFFYTLYFNEFLNTEVAGVYGLKLDYSF